MLAKEKPDCLDVTPHHGTNEWSHAIKRAAFVVDRVVYDVGAHVPREVGEAESAHHLKDRMNGAHVALAAVEDQFEALSIFVFCLELGPAGPGVCRLRRGGLLRDRDGRRVRGRDICRGGSLWEYRHLREPRIVPPFQRRHELVSLSVILDLGAPVTTTAEERETSALWDAYSVCLG